ncbi:transcriptional regulator ATRX homolog [Cynara cardunculus var. scolymus]|uniref:Uncharacterized protein n=1 Tax=Cynara cardunculus var. scolymus TaxID=59895 RepID=A0A118K6D5_CYNCS|nr:transcriptional regulator ATRX homolog [Cynara cardunculus var. scolymus]KVI10487.1 hypothetical protein Ccrd_011137 [Cynara cardunculus var. scolymus]
MGRSGLSSKRKHSKKKSMKDSSEGRRKKRSSRNKSKKLRRHDDSFSSDDDDVSTSSSLVSSSSSEGEYKSRRARSHTRNEVKGSRKRSRRRSLSEESGKDSPLVKKRKRSKKKADSEMRKKSKKIKKKKKSRRDAYISSASSGSSSCSTCGDRNSSSDEGASLGRRRSRSREKKKDHRDSIKGRKGHRKNRSRSRSSSPSKLSNSFDDDDNIEKVMVENNSRRLKSIITVAKPPENEEENDKDMKKDELKEEIVYDYDDYPSCKSNDSNDGESKKELVDRSNVSPEKRRLLTSVIGEVNSSSSLKDNEPVSPDKNPGKECVGSKEDESNASGNMGSEVDKLESILRQKALENLSRFRGGIQTKTVVPVDNKHKSDQSGVKQSIIQTPSRLPVPEQDSYSTMAVPQPVIPRSRFTWRRDPSVTIGKEEKAATNSGTESCRPQAPAPKLQTANLSSTPCVENKMKIMKNTGHSIGGIETNDGQKATTGLETKEGSSKEQQTESNNSQFEKKTMSVMRGGEMVQVSYKVYIPNRAPALARRQLKR